MPNLLDVNGLQIKSLNDILTDLTNAYKAIYGSDINLNSNSPDGQLLNIFAQSLSDQLERLVDVYNSFDVDKAYGISLDRLFALNNVFRNPGTLTKVAVDVTVSQAVTIHGLDSTTTPFTIKDSAGNQYQLMTGAAFMGADTEPLDFQSVATGPFAPIANDITNIVTVTTGVVSVNNPAAAYQIGSLEESDVAFKMRRLGMFKLAAGGPADSVRAALLTLPNMVDAFVAENVTGSTASGVPAHSLWCLVDNGAPGDSSYFPAIANAIYSKKAPGCGLKGSNSQIITRIGGNTITIVWDDPIAENLYIKVALLSRVSGLTFDHTAMAAYMVQNMVYNFNQSPNIGDVAAAVMAFAPQAIPTAIAVSVDGTTWLDIVNPSDYQHKFKLDASRITITGS